MDDKGGAESTVRIAKADVVPTEANLRPDYETFADLEAACQAAMDRFNRRQAPRGDPPGPGRGT